MPKKACPKYRREIKNILKRWNEMFFLFAELCICSFWWVYWITYARGRKMRFCLIPVPCKRKTKTPEWMMAVNSSKQIKRSTDRRTCVWWRDRWHRLLALSHESFLHQGQVHATWFARHKSGSPANCSTRCATCWPFPSKQFTRKS